MSDTLTPEKIRELKYASAIAGALLTMAPLYARMPGGHPLHVHAVPWDCLETAKAFADAGAEYVSISPAFCHDWYWTKPEPAPKRSRRPVSP